MNIMAKIKTYYVYAGYYENFISGHKLPKPYTLRAEFKTFDDAVNFVWENWEDDGIFFTEDVIDDGIKSGWIDDENWESFLMKESDKKARKSLKESFVYEGEIPIERLMEITDDVWRDTGKGLFGDSSHWDDEMFDNDKYLIINSVLDFVGASNSNFNNKKVQKLYDDECNKVYYEVNKDDDEYYDTLQEYDPIWFTLSIDLKEGIMYADVDLSNGLGMVEVAREKLPDDEREFEKAVKRMIEAF